MSLTPEWRTRIDRWINRLPELFYRKLGTVELEGFATLEQLPPDEAAKGDFQPMPPGTQWGGKWQYGWFRTTVNLPDEAKGRRIHVHLGSGGEGTLWLVNGQAVDTDEPATYGHCLTRQAAGGETFDILVEAYAGHGPRPCSASAMPLDRDSVPEPPARQVTIKESHFGFWADEVYQLWVDATTLRELRDNLADQESLRVSQIDDALKQMTLTADLELPFDEMIETVKAGRKVLSEELAKTNGPSAPVMYGFGHGHLDVAWLWPLQETDRKAARTLAKQLSLADEYPEHKFLHSQPHLFWMVMNHYPELWERVKQGVADGKIIADGGSWVEMDTNITGGESLIRQFVHGKRFVKEHFGVDNEMLWLPDVFGYTAALPQVLRGCGINYFATAKIFWNYPGGETFPHNTFTWEGIDGTDVKVHLMNDYNAKTTPSHLIQRWKERVQKDGISMRLFPFGWGDGGGGPAKDHLEFAKRTADLEGCPKLKLATPMEFFAAQDQAGWPDIRYVGELYFQAHRGVYTSQAKTKKGNRKSELGLREAEMWSALAQATGAGDYPADTFDECWRDVLLLQFHDILPGSSIERVYEEAEATYEQVLAAADQAGDTARQALAGQGEGLTVFNSLSWPRKALVELPDGQDGAIDAEGDALCVQEIDGQRLVETEVPPCGCTTLTPADGPRKDSGCGCGPKAGEWFLDNGLVRAEFDDFGQIISLVDSESGRQLTAGPCNQFRMFKDVPGEFDAWDIDSMYEKQPVELPDKAELEVIGSGPLVARLRIRRKLHASQMEQVVSLRRGQRMLTFETTIDWQERHKLLKVAFPVDIHADHALHEIQFGHVTRPNHRSRQYDVDRFEVCNHKWTALAESARGLAVLNDCKYGVNVLGKTINLTLLKSALAPDMRADLGTQTFTYALRAWNGPLIESQLVQAGYELNVPVRTADGAGGHRSFLSVDADNVVIETVKAAEDGSGDLVVRLYESMRTATDCTLSVGCDVKAAHTANMLESADETLAVSGNQLALTFRPFEIKTLRLTPAR